MQQIPYISDDNPLSMAHSNKTSFDSTSNTLSRYTTGSSKERDSKGPPDSTELLALSFITEYCLLDNDHAWIGGALIAGGTRAMVKYCSSLMRRLLMILFPSYNCKVDMSSFWDIMTMQQPTLYGNLRQASFQCSDRGFALPGRSSGGSSSNHRRSSTTTRTVRGLRNFGQTCFLNAVLQCLASLDPFVAYLTQIAAVLADAEESKEYDGHGDNNEHDAPPMPIMLLHILYSINVNNHQYRRAMDPRPILFAVSQEHEQFRSSGSSSFGSRSIIYNQQQQQQQDAQEFLQAVLDMIVELAKLNVMSSVVPFVFHDKESGGDGPREWTLDDDDEEILTVLSGNNKAKRDLDSMIGTTIVAPVNDGHGSPLGLPCELSEVAVMSSKREESTTAEQAVPSGLQNGSVSSCSTKKESKAGQPLQQHDDQSTRQVYEPQQRESSYSDSGDDDMAAQQDEKKQEDFQVHIPYVASEESLLSDKPNLMIQPSTTVEKQASRLGDSMASTMSGKGRKLSAAMRMMLDSTSSLTPSPFCGWLGSALQCCGCKHIRPIQNTPFLDIPVIPTAVSDYLSGSSMNIHGGMEPIKCSPTTAGPPCTLERMLEQFIQVERVHDVECRNCTILREIDSLESDIEMWEGCIQSLVSKANRNCTKSNEDDPAKDIRADLESAKQRLHTLQKISPDEEGALERVLAQESALLNVCEPSVSIERKDAFKRLLLTRLPSLLALHVQRRFYDPSTNRMSKTVQHVVFPEYLDVAPYWAYGGVMDGVSTSRSGPSQSIHYRLEALIEHYGGAFYGHYVAYRRDPSTGSWLYISDDIVKPVSWEHVRSRQAYMLFYEAI
jgi:ubiquitin C-terminal hydrolase